MDDARDQLVALLFEFAVHLVRAECGVVSSEGDSNESAVGSADVCNAADKAGDWVQPVAGVRGFHCVMRTSS